MLMITTFLIRKRWNLAIRLEYKKILVLNLILLRCVNKYC